MGVTIFVTGHLGYIGRYLINRLLKIPVVTKVVGYDIAEGDDILDLNNLIRKMSNVSPFIVIHLAALSNITECNENPQKAIKYNAQGTRNVIYAMRICSCKNIIYASSCAVYQDTKSSVINEKTPSRPDSVYGFTKLLGEQVIFNEFFNNDGSYLIFRMFNVVGGGSLVGGHDRIFSALSKGEITLYGDDYETYDGSCVRDYISLDDVCEAYCRGCEMFISTQSVKESINICFGKSYSVFQLIDIWNNINRNLNFYQNCKSVSVTYGYRRLGDRAQIYGDNSFSQFLLKWRPSTDLYDIVVNHIIKLKRN